MTTVTPATTTTNYRKFSYETLIQIIELANKLDVPPEQAARRWMRADARDEIATGVPLAVASNNKTAK